MSKTLIVSYRDLYTILAMFGDRSNLYPVVDAEKSLMHNTLETLY